ncbi:MAG: hypothetical protein QM648_05680 [Solirubrobacterales bacterium]
MRNRILGTIILVICLFALGGISTAAATSHQATIAKKKKKKFPEDDSSLGPTKSAGYFLGYPTMSSSWHGCRKNSLYTLDPETSILPTTGITKGNAQSKITFTRNPTRPFLSWKVASGWTICGVEANGLLANPDVDSLLLAGFGYTSGRSTGSTAPGAETIRVKIAKGAINAAGYEKFEGKTFSISEVVDVIVWVRKKK